MAVMAAYRRPDLAGMAHVVVHAQPDGRNFELLSRRDLSAGGRARAAMAGCGSSCVLRAVRLRAVHLPATRASRAQGTVMAEQEPIAIEAQDLGIKFRRNRVRHRRFSDIWRQQKGRARSEFWALRNVTFQIPVGESVGIVGANGQGKSTLLKLVAGTLIPDEGWVRLDGGVAPLVNISGGFKNDLTVRDNLHIVGGLHGMLRDEVDAKFDGIIEFAEVGDFIDTPFRHLSSGMRTRVAFALITS